MSGEDLNFVPVPDEPRDPARSLADFLRHEASSLKIRKEGTDVSEKSKIPWRVDPELAAGREFMRFHLGPPPDSPMGVQPPFCPMAAGSFGHVQGPPQSLIIGGQEAQQVSVKVDLVPLPCLRDRCLFWDRLEVRCGITSLLEMMLEGEEPEDEPEEEKHGDQGPVPSADG